MSREKLNHHDVLFSRVGTNIGKTGFVLGLPAPEATGRRLGSDQVYCVGDRDYRISLCRRMHEVSD